MGDRAAAPTPVPALILAAGAATRYRAAGGTGPKVLVTVAGRPLLTHVADVAAAAGLAPVVVVVSDVVADAGDDVTAGMHLVVNPDPGRGIGASLRIGLAALADRVAPDAEACVVLLADQPGIDAQVVREVVDTWRATGRATRARYRDGAGHPVVLPRSLWSSLRTSTTTAGDEGARGLLAQLDVLEVEVDAAAPVDVDVPSDIALVDTPAHGDHGDAP
jgi:molybdenum cofactor cytidylyltransferase